MFRVALLAMAATLVAASIAQAQEAIPTATTAPGGDAPLPPAPPPPHAPSVHSSRVWARPAYGPCGPLRRKADGTIAPNSDQAHGEVSAAVGTGGYREAAGVVCQPIGDSAAVTLGVDVGGWGRGH